MDPQTKQTYYGRGYVQLTWRSNYAKFSPITGADLVWHADRALETPIAQKVITIGMRDGKFTGVGLRRYINANKCDFYNARRIVNGMDKARTFANSAVIIARILKKY